MTSKLMADKLTFVVLTSFCLSPGMVAVVPGSPHGTLGYLHHAVRVQGALTQLSGVPGMGT